MRNNVGTPGEPELGTSIALADRCCGYCGDTEVPLPGAAIVGGVEIPLCDRCHRAVDLTMRRRIREIESCGDGTTDTFYAQPKTWHF